MIRAFVGEYRWLSNFWICKVELDGETYSSVEEAYVASKSLEIRIRKMVKTTPTPGAAKKFGRMIKLRDDWEEIKVPIMLHLLRQKFLKGSKLGNMLLSTGNQELIEGNTWGDIFWGEYNGKGLNILGKLLMQVREEIK